MRTTLSIGEYATTPYYISGLEIPVYCIEELAFCMKENAFLLDAGIMNDELLDFIGNGCKLKELSRQLSPIVHRQGLLSTFVSMILEYVGLYDRATIGNVVQLIKKNSGLSNIEKRKEKIDYLVNNRKYMAAVRGYDALLAKWNSEGSEKAQLPAPGVRAAIIHNKGVALAGMMLYSQAAECFLESYDITGNSEEYVTYLAAMRMGLSESEYVVFASDLENGYAGTLQLERTMERLRKEWVCQADYQRLSTRRQMRLGADKQKYYDENERLIQALKDSYRDCTGEL